MDSDEVTVCYIDYLPVELLVIAFTDLTLADLVHCSSVSLPTSADSNPH